jgi:hypothetical protein
MYHVDLVVLLWFREIDGHSILLLTSLALYFEYVRDVQGRNFHRQQDDRMIQDAFTDLY